MDVNMDEHSSASDSEEIDISSDIAFLGTDTLEVKSIKMAPVSYESTLDDDPDRLLRFAQKYGDMPKPKPAKSEEDDSLHDKTLKFPHFPFPDENVKRKVLQIAQVNESTGLIELDVKKLERRASSLDLEETTEDSPSQKANYVELLREKLLKYKMLEKDETSDMQTEPEDQEQKVEKLAPYKYEKKNKLWDRKPHLREMSREFLAHQYHEVNFTEEALEMLGKDLINNVESDLNCAVNILRRIAYPKLCEKHFLPEFPSGAFAVEDEPIENISVSVDHFEFLHKELPIDILQLFQIEDFNVIASEWEKDPQINSKVPSFIKFLKNDKFKFPEKSFTLILSILNNPYRKFEYFYDVKLPVMKEQMAITEYLLNSLKIPKIIDDKDAFEKLSETIITFANIHPVFHGLISGGFGAILESKMEGLPAFYFARIYSKVFSIMTSIGAAFIGVCLPHHFKKMSCVAYQYIKCNLYFHLLRACEISFANTVEYESPEKVESSDKYLFYAACYIYFKDDLFIRLIPVYRKYENRKNREQQYLSKKHFIFPTKYGYMDLEMLFLINRNKIRGESELSNITKVKECTEEGKEWNSADKVLFNSPNSQFGYIIQDSMNEMLVEDIDYYDTSNEFLLYSLEDVTDESSSSNEIC